MGETKFLKAYCDKVDQHFGLEIKEIDGTYRVVNFINITPVEAKVMTSAVRQSRFLTNDNLLPCNKCGGRQVGGCVCATRTVRCRKGMRYNFQCIYCKNMKLDYSTASAAQGLQKGDTIRLSQGQVVRISFEDSKPLTRITVGIGWDPLCSDQDEIMDMDIDSSVIVAGKNGRETVYFSQLTHPSGCVVHHGDNLTGEDDYLGPNKGDDENISVYLDKVPYDRDRLIFVLNIFDCETRNQRLSNVRNMYIRLYDPVSKRALVEYKVNGNHTDNTALVIGMAFREGGEWKFKAIGHGSKATSVHTLADMVARTYTI